MWFEFALLAAAANAANQILTKRLSKSFGAIEISAFGQFAFATLIFPFYFVSGVVMIPNTIQFHAAAWMTISLNIVAILLLVDAISKSDLSYALPFLAVSPVFTLLTAWIIRGESLSFVGIAGIITVVIGALGIDATSLHDWFSFGGKRVFRDKGVWRVLGVAFLYALSTVYDKTATLLSSPLTFTWYSALCRAVILLGIFAVWNRHQKRIKTLNHHLSASGNTLSREAANTASEHLHHMITHTPHQLTYQPSEIGAQTGGFMMVKPMKSFESYLSQGAASFLIVSTFILIGATFVIEAVSQTSALQSGFVACVFAVKRLSILLTSTAGIIFFGEEFTWFRLLGATIMVCGTCCIYFS